MKEPSNHLLRFHRLIHEHEPPHDFADVPRLVRAVQDAGMWLIGVVLAWEVFVGCNKHAPIGVCGGERDHIRCADDAGFKSCDDVDAAASRAVRDRVGQMFVKLESHWQRAASA